MWVIPPTRSLCRICGGGLPVIQRNHNMCSVFGHGYSGAHYTVPGSFYVNLTTRFQQWFFNDELHSSGISHDIPPFVHIGGVGHVGADSRWAVRSSKTYSAFSALLPWIKLCVCAVSLPAGGFHHAYAYVLALDIIISRFVLGAQR